MNNDKKIRTVYHLHLNVENQDFYYGSMSAMYHHLDGVKDALKITSAKDRLGISLQSLTNFFNKCKKDNRENLYMNAACTIRKALLITNVIAKDEASSE